MRYEITAGMRNRLDKIFTYHSPKDDQAERYQLLRKSAKELAHLIAVLTPSSDEQSRALDALENVVFNANAAIARGES